MVTAAPPTTDRFPTLPGRYYYDPAIFALEQERLFSTNWMLVGRADAIPHAGDYFLAEVGGESVMVVRDKSGRVGAFYNVCRHRGARLCTEERGRLRSTVQCRYHAWTYGLDGALIGAPNMRGDVAFDPAENGLVPVAVQVWEGLIFLNLADEPRSILEQGTLAHPRLALYHLGELKVARAIAYDVKANWKIVVANYEECAHCALVHPELSAEVPLFRAGEVGGGLDDGAEFAEGVDSLTPSGKTNRPPLPHLTAEEQRHYYGMVIRPNAFVDFHPDYVIVTMLQPLAADHTRIVSDWLFDAGTMARSDFDPSDAVEFNDLVGRQDATVCELNQLGVTSRGFRSGGSYGTNERHIVDFDDYVLRHLGHDRAAI